MSSDLASLRRDVDECCQRRRGEQEEEEDLGHKIGQLAKRYELCALQTNNVIAAVHALAHST